MDFFCPFPDFEQTMAVLGCADTYNGAPKIAKLPYKWLYGRYNYSYWELFHGL